MSRNKFGLSRYISLRKKSEIRKRCGYGCVLCGNFFYEYDHFNPPFSEAKLHSPAGITLLCHKHHKEVTNGLLSRETVRKANESPFCLTKGNPHYLLEDLEYPFEISLGGIVFLSSDGVLLESDDEELLSIKKQEHNQPPLITARFSSEKNDELKIIENEIVVSRGNWDIETKKSEIIIRTSENEIFFHLIFTPPKKIEVVKIKNMYHGHIIDTELGGKLFIQSANGAKIDFTSGFIAAGGKISMDRNKGITIDGGAMLMGSELPNAFKGGTDHLRTQMKRLKEL